MVKEKKHTNDSGEILVNKKKKIRRANLLQLGLSLLIIILLNIIGSFVFTRIDLTQEKRYTLSHATRNLLRNLDDVVYFQVYLDGDFPAGFKRLRNSSREMLDEFRAYSDNIQYKFINPSAGKDKKSVQDLYTQLRSKGLEPTEFVENKADGVVQQIIFPGAIATYKDKEIPVQFLTSQRGVDPERVLNNSIIGLEYYLANAIRKLTLVNKQKIAFIEGHGELNRLRLSDITRSLSEYYSVDYVTIDGKLNSLATRDTNRDVFVNKFDAIIIAKPDSAFPESDKYMIDQFIMRGGKVLWFIDPVFASMDSLQNSPETIGFPRALNLDDMLFRYGVRINTNLIMDMSCMQIPVVTGSYGGQPQQSLLPWYYFPVAIPTASHPIVKNINSVSCEFVSEIDTLKTPGIRKTILLTSSKYSRTLVTPCRIGLDIMHRKPDERFFDKAHLPVAVLLEGRFQSNFVARGLDEIESDKASFDFRSEIEHNQMIVVSDGDIIKNQLYKGSPLPLGYDMYTNQMFGNKEFVLNAVDYLCDSSGLITVRSREMKIRLLDKARIQKDRVRLQVVNTVVPVVAVLVFGLIWILVRRKKFTRKSIRKSGV